MYADNDNISSNVRAKINNFSSKTKCLHAYFYYISIQHQLNYKIANCPRRWKLMTTTTGDKNWWGVLVLLLFWWCQQLQQHQQDRVHKIAHWSHQFPLPCKLQSLSECIHIHESQCKVRWMKRQKIFEFRIFFVLEKTIRFDNKIV